MARTGMRIIELPGTGVRSQVGDVLGREPGSGPTGATGATGPEGPTGPSGSGGDVLSIATAENLPFDIPISGSYGTPDNMTIAFVDGAPGDKFEVVISAFIANGDVSTHSVNGRIFWTDFDVNDHVLANTPPFEVQGEGQYYLVMHAVLELADAQATFSFSAGFLADGAGPDVTAYAYISVTRQAAA
jgi:hypothetical protein